MITKQQAIEAAEGPFRTSVANLEKFIDAALKGYKGETVKVSVKGYSDQVVQEIMKQYINAGWNVVACSISHSDYRESWNEPGLAFS